MEGIFLGKLDQTVFNPRCISLSFRTKHLDQHVEVRKELDYDCDYVLVKADDVIKTNDELLTLRDEVKQWEVECNDWRARYAKANNELFQKGLAYNTLEGAYKNEKIAGEMLLKDRDALKEKVDKLEAELTEIKTARTLREAYITGVEKGCEGLREERDRWKSRWNSVVTDIGESLKANGITFVLKEIHGEGNWDVVIDIPELNEAKKKVEDLEKKLKAAKFNETFWRGRKEEMESYHHYWLNTFDRAVKLAAEKGIHIGVRGNDDECNAGIVVVDNVKAEELEKTNKNLKEKLGAADNALEYWNNTYNDIVIAGKKVGVKIDIKGKRPDSNAGFVYVTNEKIIELSDVKQKQDKKWQAMLDALKNKGVEAIYMGEEDGKPVVDVNVPAIDILRKDYVVRGQTISDLKREIENLKSKKVATCTLAADADGRIEFIYTYMDGHNEAVNINCLCKNHVAVDAESISHGTIPACKSCAHYMHNPSRFTHDWCYMPIPKEGGAGYIRKLSKEESEGPACSDYKARKE